MKIGKQYYMFIYGNGIENYNHTYSYCQSKNYVLLNILPQEIQTSLPQKIEVSKIKGYIYSLIEKEFSYYRLLIGKGTGKFDFFSKLFALLEMKLDIIPTIYKES